MLGLGKLLLGAGAAYLGIAALGKRGKGEAGIKGLRLREGEQALITFKLSPMPIDVWQGVMKDGAQQKQIRDNVFPVGSPYTVINFTPQPAAGIFSTLIMANKDTTFRPMTKTLGLYTLTTLDYVKYTG